MLCRLLKHTNTLHYINLFLKAGHYLLFLCHIFWESLMHRNTQKYIATKFHIKWIKFRPSWGPWIYGWQLLLNSRAILRNISLKRKTNINIWRTIIFSFIFVVNFSFSVVKLIFKKTNFLHFKDSIGIENPPKIPLQINSKPLFGNFKTHRTLWGCKHSSCRNTVPKNTVYVLRK